MKMRTFSSNEEIWLGVNLDTKKPSHTYKWESILGMHNASLMDTYELSSYAGNVLD